MTIVRGDCVEVMAAMPAASVDAVVCDPPYGLEFMGKDWDRLGASATHRTDRVGEMSSENKQNVRTMQAWHETWAREALRVLKPGGHLLAFGGTRTYHRLACAIEDAGFEIRDTIAWMYGSGFPKSLDVAKAIVGAERGEPQGGAKPSSPHHGQYRTTTTEGKRWDGDSGQGYGAGGSRSLASTASERTTALNTRTTTDPAAAAADDPLPSTQAATADAERWAGWGTALKPAWESVVVAVKPDHGTEREAVDWNLCLLGNKIASLSPANTAVHRSASSQAEHDAALLASARWTADERSSTRAALCAPMDTSQFESAISTSLSIVSSWRRTLAEFCELTSTSTIATESSMTTALRTLRYCSSGLTPHTIIEALTNRDGSTLDALPAAQAFAAVALSLSATRSLSAIESAIEPGHTSQPDGAARPLLEPIVVARKPLAGTVAANVLAHGTGSMNIDGCRIRGPKTSASDRGESLGGEARSRGCPVHGLRGVRHADASAKSASKTGEAADQLQPRVQGEGDDGGGQPSVDGRSMDRSTERVSPPANGPPQRDGSGAVTDADAARDNGAPSCDVATHGSPAADARACASHQWREGGQSAGEPDDDGLVAALAGAPYGAAATSDSRRGEPRPARCTCGNGGVNEAIAGRWPANVCLDERAAALLDEQTGTLTSGKCPEGYVGPYIAEVYGRYASNQIRPESVYGDSGGASRFFYCAKTSGAERNAGLDGFEENGDGAAIRPQTRCCNVCGTKAKAPGPGGRYPNCEHDDWDYVENEAECHKGAARNIHPTVKPIALMRWLVRLVTPPGGTVLDPFTGSGSTGIAAVLEGFEFVGIEREAEYAAIAEPRIAWWARHPDGMTLVARLEAEADRSAVAASGQISIFDVLEPG